jgi:hypothetical protein
LLSPAEVSSAQIGNIICLGTPFFSYKTLNPSTGFWKKVEQFASKQKGRPTFGSITAIRSKYDEAYHLLKRALDIREGAFELSRQLSQTERSSSLP